MRAAYAIYLPRMDCPPAPMSQDFTDPIARGFAYVLDGQDCLSAGIVFWPAPDHLMIETIAVHPSAQGRGLGRALMSWTEERAQRSGHAALRLYTNAVMVENIAFYQRQGYRITGRVVMDGFDRLWFEKTLPQT